MRRVLQLAALGAVLTFTATADVVIGFEGLPNNDEVLSYFNGGQDGALNTGPSDGVIFADDAYAFISADDPTGTADFGGDPLGDTIVTFEATSGIATINVPGGFTTGFSFYYSSPVDSATILIFSGPDDTGTQLASFDIHNTGDGNTLGNPACPNPTDTYCPLFPAGVSFDGVAQSVDFNTTIGAFVFDDFTFGSSTPELPEPATCSLLGLGLATLLVISRRRRKLR